MKRVLLFTLVFAAIAAPIRGQDLDMSVSEYMQMDEVERNAFSSFLIGFVLSSVDPQLEIVRDCIGKWVRESPTHWLSSLTDWMSTVAMMANLGSQTMAGRFDLVLQKADEALADGIEKDRVEEQVLAYLSQEGVGSFGSLEEIRRANLTSLAAGEVLIEGIPSTCVSP